MKKILSHLPVGLPSIIVLLLILYATLFPHPLPEDSEKFFSGIDKVVHFIMFFVLVVTVCFDYAKMLYPISLKAIKYILVGFVVVAIGGAIEVLQSEMGLGRTGSFSDLLADAVGAASGAIIASIFLRKYCHKLFK